MAAGAGPHTVPGIVADPRIEGLNFTELTLRYPWLYVMGVREGDMVVLENCRMSGKRETIML